MLLKCSFQHTEFLQYDITVLSEIMSHVIHILGEIDTV